MMNFLDRSNTYGDIDVENTYTIDQTMDEDVPKAKK